jgi:hypothetical protein
MEHPFFTLSTKPDTKIRYYEHNGNTVTIAPSAWGLATIHDKDILIYCTSQLMMGINQGRTPSRTVHLKARDLLVATNRPTGGESYKRLEQAFSRLTGTLIETNIKTNGQEINKKFHILESVKTIYSSPKTKRMVKLEVTLSEWLYNSILGEQVLSISRDYFRLRKPIERRIYEIARKHCGQQQRDWKIGMKNLHKKVGSTATLSKFKFILNHIIKYNHLPDYGIRTEGNNVVFFLSKENAFATETTQDMLRLKPATLKNAKKILQQHYDVDVLQAEWEAWWESTGKPDLKSPDGAFINFFKKRMLADGVILTTDQQIKVISVPNIRDGTQLQAWAIANGLPVAPVGFDTTQYYRMLCNHVERVNSAEERAKEEGERE